MPNIESNHIVDQNLHRAVIADHQPREAEHVTKYDDGTEGRSVRMLYWYTKDKTTNYGEVRSCTLEDWPAVQADMMGDALVAGKQEQTEAKIFEAAAPLVGKPISNISAPELNALLEVVIYALGGIDGARNLIDPALWASRPPMEQALKPVPHKG